MRAAADQQMFVTAVAMGKVFSVALAAQEVLARTETVRERIVNAEPLHEVLAHVLAVSTGGPLACHGWVGGALSGSGHARCDHERQPRSARSTCVPLRPVCPAASIVPPRGHPRRFCGKTGRLIRPGREEAWCLIRPPRPLPRPESTASIT